MELLLEEQWLKPLRQLSFDSNCWCYNSALFAENDAYIFHAAAASAGTSNNLGGTATAQND